MKANWGDWNLPASLCDFYLAMDVVCSTSSIFNLVAISLDRFLAVTSPILYSQHRHNTRPAKIVILLCWTLSLAIGLPIMFGLNYWPQPTHLSQVRWSDPPSDCSEFDCFMFFFVFFKNVSVVGSFCNSEDER